MYRQRLIQTPVNSTSAKQLQDQLLAYHDFRQHKSNHPLGHAVQQLARWQSERLRQTHQDLYQHPGYHHGLEFLLTDLYAPAGMTRRDDNIDRIFPKMVKWLPNHLLDTFRGLVELNLITQRMDLRLGEWLHQQGVDPAQPEVSAYCEAFRASDDGISRQRQIELVETVGGQLDRYVRNRSLGWLLSMTRGAAEMAELSDLHQFLHRGYSAFRSMDEVEPLIRRLVARETRVLEQIMAGHPEPFRVPDHL